MNKSSSRGQKTKGIILKRINYRDADRILTVYTSSLGKIQVIAKGSRKIESKKRAHIEPFVECEMYLIKTGEWYLVTQTQIINTHNQIRIEQSSIIMATLICEAFDKITEQNEPSEISYRLLAKTLNLIKRENIYILTPSYLIKLLRISGFYNKENLIAILDNLNMKNSHQLIVDLEKLTYEDILTTYQTQSEINLKNLTFAILEYFEKHVDIKLRSLDVHIDSI